MSLPHFNGDAYVHERDAERLTKQLDKVRDLCLDGVWRGLAEIAALLGEPHASVSAQLRNLRKPRFGAYNVERRWVYGGYYEYRVLTTYTTEGNNNE